MDIAHLSRILTIHRGMMALSRHGALGVTDVRWSTGVVDELKLVSKEESGSLFHGVLNRE